MTGRAELLEAFATKLTHRIHRGLEEFARIEFGSRLRCDLAEHRGHREAAIGVDIDLAHAASDAVHDLFHRYAPGLRHLAAELVEHVLERLRHRGRAVHDQVRVRQPAVNFLDNPTAWSGSVSN